MDFSDHTDDAVQLAVDLANAFELDFSRPSDVERFLADHEVFETRRRVTARDHAEVLEVGRRVRAVFAAGSASQVARGLNGLMGSVGVHPELTDHDGVWHLHYTPETASIAQRLAATSAMALAGVLVAFGPGRFKTCEAGSCDDVFVDTSRNHTRRWCSDRCANRENVAAFRARARGRRSS